METTEISRAGVAEAGLAAAMAAWARLPTLTVALAQAGSIHLVVDPKAGRILYASKAAGPLADALNASGLTALVRQVAHAAPAEGSSRLARLRLDPRRIAPPALCWLAPGPYGTHGSAILVVPTGPLAFPRVRPGRPSVAHGDELEATRPALTVETVVPTRTDRFLWRIDAAGVLTTLTGPDALAGLIGRPWRDLVAEGRIADADAVLAALHARRTFRAEPAILNGGTGAFRVELSGTPMGRGEAAFSGFGGFGLIRTAPSAHAADTASAVGRPGPVAGPEPIRGEPLPEAVAVDPAATALSNDEHAAFREIARALGARYAGDETEGAPRMSKQEGGAVMPFPGVQAALAEPSACAPASSPEQEILDGLPLPALVHRGDTILWANRRLLDLVGYADLPALATAGLARLFRGLLQPEETDPTARRTAVKNAAGHAEPVEALGGPCLWAGQPATCLLVRPLDEADLLAALSAERLAGAAEAERALSAEAALDGLVTGIVTIDGAGRIVGLNRAAAGLIECDPREIVGSSFVGLFERDSVLAVADILRGVAEGPHPVGLAGKPVNLSVSAIRADGRRVAMLDPRQPGAETSTSATPVAEGPAPGAALTRLDHAFREPLAGMIHLAGAMLKEPFGPIGDARYRGCLAEIKASGEAVLERVGELLDLASVEAGALRLEPRPLVLNDVVAECVAQLQAEAARGRIVVRTSFSSDLGEVEADERSVSRAASLVIEHAIRRSAVGGQIIVSTGSAERATIALRVRDTGAGAAIRPAVADDDRVEDGLALPRALVEANGGRLQLSARPEDGTLVEIIMPTRRAANG